MTLPRLMRDENFRKIIQKLKIEGYLDWQVLNRIMGIVVDYRMKASMSPQSSLEEEYEMTRQTVFREEREDDREIPLELFKEGRINFQLKIDLAAVAKTWGLVLHSMAPDIDALKKLLDTRYNNSSDDIEHEDFFLETKNVAHRGKC